MSISKSISSRATRGGALSKIWVAVLLPHALIYGALPLREVMLRGIVTADVSITAGSIALYDGDRLLQSSPSQNFYNGTFAVPLTPAAAAVLATGGNLRVKVQVSDPPSVQSGTLETDLQAFDPDRDVAFVNLVTTVESNYIDQHPGISEAQASAVVSPALAVGGACKSTRLSDFNNQAFLSESIQHGGLNAYAGQVAAQADSAAVTPNPQIAYGATPAGSLPLVLANSNALRESTGEVLSAAAANAAAPDFLGLFKSLASSLAIKAFSFSEIPLGDVFGGWIIEEIFKAATAGPGEVDKLGRQLKKIAAQQDEILAGISDLSRQIAESEKTITDQVKLASYQAQAQDVQKSVNDICSMEDQLLLLARADPRENNSGFAKNLQQRIQNSASVDLENIWSGVEGNGGLLPGLITRWSQLVGEKGGPSYLFVDLAALRTAAPNLRYYLGAEVVGLNLETELAHVLGSQGSPNFAKQLITKNFADYNSHLDFELKKLAHNRGFTRIADATYYATVPLPASLDRYTIDTRSGDLWRKAPSSTNPTFTHAWGWYYYPSGRATTPAQDLSIVWPDFPDGEPMARLNEYENDQIVDTGGNFKLDFQVATRLEWSYFVNPDYREDQKAKSLKPSLWLKSHGFILPADPGLSFWTSDIAEENQENFTRSGWTNWVIDLNQNDPDRQIWYLINGNPKDPVQQAYVLLRSRSLTTPYENLSRFFYRADEYSVTPSGK